jgi:hypothetical protein
MKPKNQTFVLPGMFDQGVVDRVNPVMSVPAHFDGETFDAARDEVRLTGQLLRVFSVMADEQWRTLDAIARQAEPATEASVSARLRDLRKPRFGGHAVERRHLQHGCFEYRVRVSRHLLTGGE